MIQLEIEVQLLYLLVLQSTCAASLTRLVYDPIELVPLVELPYLDIVRQALASSHEVAVVFLVTLVALLVRVLLRWRELTDEAQLHLDVLLEDFSFLTHLECINGDAVGAGADFFNIIAVLAVDY